MREGTKFDQRKIRWDLLPPEALNEIALILTFGAQKYEPRNWEKGIKYSRIFGALQRHLWSWWSGEDLDNETKRSHLAHAGACLLFLLSFELRNMKKFDDRPRDTTRIIKTEV